MLNLINKFLPPRHLRIPLLGLLLILGVVGEKAKPVLSNQTAKLFTATTQELGNQATTYTWLQGNSSTETEVADKQSRLRKALSKSVSVPTQAVVKPTEAPPQVAHNEVKTYTWLQRNSRLDSELNQGEYTQQVPTITNTQDIAPKATNKTGMAGKAKLPKQNGIYLYGQSPKPGQFGRGYVVFEKHQGQVMGALYMPSSEFSCFKGTIEPSGELAMTVRGYPGEISPSQVASTNGLPIKGDNDQPVTYGHSIALQEYYRLNSVSANDQQILQACKANLQQ